MKTTFGKTVWALSLASVFLVLSACDGDDHAPSVPYTLGGTVSGLSGAGLVLQLNGGHDLAVSADGSFTFAANIAASGTYQVTVKTQPTGPAQTCSVANGLGDLAGANVANVAVSCYDLTGHFAYVSSLNDNNISGFAIQTNGVLGPLAGSPFATGLGDDQVFKLAISPSGKFLAIAGSEHSNLHNEVGMFAIDATSGELTPVPGALFATEPGAGTGWVAFDKTGSYLYTANFVTNNVSAFSVDAVTGALTRVAGSPFAVGAGPFAVEVDPSNKFVLTANTADDTVTVLAINPATGALTQVAGSPFAAGDFTAAIAFGAGGKFVYTQNIGTDANGVPLSTFRDGSLSGFSLNAATGALVPLTGSPFAIGGEGFLTADSAGTVLYIPSADGLSNYSIDAATGALTAVAGIPFAAGANPSEASVNPSDSFAYITNTDDSTITGYAINASTAVLTPLPGSPFAVAAQPYNIVTN
jgi:6-phosphogluconolactonase